jgi:hypothetical protein
MLKIHAQASSDGFNFKYTVLHSVVYQRGWSAMEFEGLKLAGEDLPGLAGPV